MWINIFNIAVCITTTVSYKPVFFIHGLLDNQNIFNYAASYIKAAHPGTVTVEVDFFNGGMSIFDLWTQSERLKNLLQDHPDYSEDGIHIVAYSQGGLVSRGALMLLGNHSVHNLITLSSPHMGVYGTCPKDTKIPNLAKIFGFELFYTPFFQKTSIGNMWHDPIHEDMYLKSNAFLPILNNEKNHSRFFQFKESFLQLKNVVLIGGSDDQVVDPWQSAQFGFYDSNMNVVLMREQRIYVEDSFGLKTMDLSGRLHLFSKDKVGHHFWFRTESVIRDFVLPFLD